MKRKSRGPQAPILDPISEQAEYAVQLATAKMVVESLGLPIQVVAEAYGVRVEDLSKERTRNDHPIPD